MEDYKYEYDFDDVDPSAQEAEELRYPRAAWYNGSPKAKAIGGLAYTGGMFVRREPLGESVEIPHWTIGGFEADGKTIETLENAHPVIAPVRYRRRWVRLEGRNVAEWYPINQQHRSGFKIEIDAVGFIKGYDSPILFNLRGYAATALLDAMRDHSAKIVSVANRKAPAGKSLPSYAFWLRLKSGAHEKVGKVQQSDATLPRLVLPSEITDDYVRGLYIGKDSLHKSQALFRSLDVWAREWSDAANHEAHSDSAYEVPEFAGAPRDEVEAAQRHLQARTAAASSQPPSFDEVLPDGIEADEIPFK